MTVLEEKLLSYAKNHLNVLLIGSHGIGKTSLVRQVADKMNYKLKYYSTPTLDPFADLVGIPVPSIQTKTVEYYRPKDLEDAEILMFDEINRGQSRVLNSILEAVQFKTINGIPLPKLKMVWACLNPPGDAYQVEELDPALIDRFQVYIKMTPELNIGYLKTKISPEVVGILKNWWETNLDDNQKKIFTPRRVEYVGMAIDKQLMWRDFIPQGHEFPLEFLSSKIKKLWQGTLDENEKEPTKDNILADPNYFKEKAKDDPKLYTIMYGVISGFDKEDLYKVLGLFEEFPKDLIVEFAKKKFSGLRRLMKKELLKNGEDIKKYPKIYDAFNWNEEE